MYRVAFSVGHLAHGASAASDPVVQIENQFGLHLPVWLVWLLTAAAIVVAFVGLLTPLVPIGRWLITLARDGARRPDTEERHRWRQYRRFAAHVHSQLQIVNSREDWREERFTDLEAEVEVEGRVRLWRRVRRSPTRTTRLRRERSLARALERSEEPIIVLEGEPGSGKSVALRHLALTLAATAAKAERPEVIPLYVNLRNFRPPGRPVGPEHVDAYIYETLAAANDRDVAAFLEQEYRPGLHDGRWLLLLDSFDEIPDVLGATDADETVREYAEAVYGFVHAMKSCRSIVASREFRGPRLSIPRFKIMPMRPAQQRGLVRNSAIRPALQDQVLGAIQAAETGWSDLAANPMFLNMVCAYVGDIEAMPDSQHAVFERYFTARLAADAERIAARFALDIETVRIIGELAAYWMALDARLGLEPDRAELIKTLSAGGDASTPGLIARVLDALEFTKLAKSSPGAGASEATFSFAHRRFQEYFATCQVLRKPEAVSPLMLLFDGQWRETAVTMIQTRTADELAPLLERAAFWLEGAVEARGDADRRGEFAWPAGALHMLGILASGIHRLAGEPARRVRALAGQLLTAAWKAGHGHDRMWALEVILAAEPAVTREILEEAMAQRSTAVHEAAYHSAGRLPEVPESLKAGIRRALVSLANDGRLYAQREQVRAQVQRLPSNADAANTLAILRIIPGLAVALAVLAPLALTVAIPEYWPVPVGVAAIGAVLESRNLSILLRHRPREARWIDRLATRPLTTLVPDTTAYVALLVRIVVGMALFMAIVPLVKSNFDAGIVTAATLMLVAPMLMMMMMAHPVEHGCIGPVRACVFGLVFTVLHLPLNMLGPALRQAASRARLARPSCASAREAAKEIGTPIIVNMVLLGTAAALYQFQSHRAAAIYGAIVGCLFIVLRAVELVPALSRRRAERARVQGVHAFDNAFTPDELRSVLRAVKSKREMTATLRTIAGASAPPVEAVRLLSDFVLIADRAWHEQGLSVGTDMYAWLTTDHANLARILRLVTNEGIDEVNRLAAAVGRQTMFQPLTQYAEAIA